MLAIAITSIFMPVSIYWLLKSVANDLHQRSLAENANAIVQHLKSTNGLDFQLNLPAEMQLLYSQAYGRYSYAILNSRGDVLFSSPKDHAPLFPEDTRLRQPAFFETKHGVDDMYGASFPKKFNGHLIWVQVSEDLAHRDVLIDDIVRDFFWRIGWIIIPILLSLLAIDVWIFRGALQPLFEASAEAKIISPTRTDIRFPVDKMPSEIAPVVQAVNQALDRLEEGYQVQRDFTADAAHELRTPLAVLRMRIDTMADKPLAAMLRQDVAGMSRVLTQLLQIAELETFVIGRNELADLGAVCANIAEFIAPLALAEQKQISLKKPDRPVWINGNAEMLARAVRNLVENGIHYAPKNTLIEIEVNSDGAIAVLDRGPGVSDEERELIFRRFWRKDRRREGSAGLGLSIVQRIAEAHGGTVDIERRIIGGTRATLSFKVLAEHKQAESPARSLV